MKEYASDKLKESAWDHTNNRIERKQKSFTEKIWERKKA